MVLAKRYVTAFGSSPNVLPDLILTNLRVDTYTNPFMSIWPCVGCITNQLTIHEYDAAGYAITNGNYKSGISGLPDDYKYPTYVILAYYEEDATPDITPMPFSTTLFSTLNSWTRNGTYWYWQGITFSNEYITISISPDGWGTVPENRSFISKSAYYQTASTTIGFYKAGITLTPMTGEGVGGVKSQFYSKTTIEDAFSADRITSVFINASTPTRTGAFGYLTDNTEAPILAGPIAVDGPAFIVPIKSVIQVVTVNSPEPTNGIPAQFWTDVINPAISYANLWAAYPTIMPSTADIVYSIRELPAMSAKLDKISNLTNEVTGIKNQMQVQGGLYSNLQQLATLLNQQNKPTRAVLHNAFPVESLMYADQITTILKKAPDEMDTMHFSIIQQLQDHPLIDTLLAQPQSFNSAIDWFAVEKLLKTGIYPR